ncbi:dihydropteroate synthase [Candidatus Blochmannia ocreatus]|uniref:Dihydropteroate synthase n=2 Tax=Candidatus Blochmannia ocreatus (nom. nud.) TaxID=251538 RepID=A0ABY4ST78_9ENTR|nr:dihydropteroate synthase [Candidatus Blochmannia ocreatus]URJ25184.1 dihydropteroate synthase [Candidatus Blochmannia ocreatus]
MLKLNARILKFSKIHVMGILNVTPDSFFDGGKYCVLSKAIDHVSNMINSGATIIDIGGESTRPGSKILSESEELERVIPIIHEVSRRFDVLISVNTSSALVMRESANINNGIHLINDIRSFTMKGAMQVAVECQLPICIMHMQGNPQNMQKSPYYSDIITEIDGYFHDQIIRFESAGISRNKLILDPGFGFGKSVAHNYKLLANLKHFHHFDIPLLIGLSRKSMLSFGQYAVQQRLIGSISCAVIAAMQGVHIIRVHDVRETVEALKAVQATLQYNKE